jgi:hypothetical protein
MYLDAFKTNKECLNEKPISIDRQRSRNFNIPNDKKTNQIVLRLANKELLELTMMDLPEYTKV